MKRIIILTAVICLNIIKISANDTMPIIAYMGVPNDRSTEANFKDFSECGFNVSLYGYASLSELIAACNIAQKYGVSILGHCPETHNSPHQAATRLKDNAGFFGYVLQDEPSAAEIKERQKEIVQLKDIDDNHCFYINLHPYYADWTLQHTKTKTYGEYLDAATSTACRQLSFDYYPITKDGIREGWYSNLEKIRSQSLKKGIPFWGFVLSVPHAIYPQPTIGSLRLQVYTNLAYGAQAIQYFTYWTPTPDKTNDYHDAPISQDGKKTKTYALVQQMNSELKTVSKLFYGAKVTSVHHLGAIPDGTTRQNDMPVNLRSLKVVGQQGAIISQLTKNGHQYLAIVNKSHENQLTVRIRLRNGVPRHLTKTLEEETMRNSYTIEAGDMLLFKLQ